MGTKIEGSYETGEDTYTTTDTETPNDVGMYIHVEATYKVDGGSDEMASLASDRPVQAELEDNTAPKFASATVDRRVMENSKDAIGAPITATDADGDVRHYWIDVTDTNGDDNDKFDHRQADRRVDGQRDAGLRQIPLTKATILTAVQTIRT